MVPRVGRLVEKEIGVRGITSREPQCSDLFFSEALFTEALCRRRQEASLHDYAKQQRFAHQLQPNQQQ